MQNGPGQIGGISGIAVGLQPMSDPTALTAILAYFIYCHIFIIFLYAEKFTDIIKEFLPKKAHQQATSFKRTCLQKISLKRTSHILI